MGRGSSDPTKWWRVRTNMEKTLLAFSLILTVTFIIVLLVGVSMHGNSSSYESLSDSSNAPCITEECLIMAGEMLDMMNSSANPCQDFYEFACGQYVKTHSVPLDHPEASVEHETSDAVRLKLKYWLENEHGSNIALYKQTKDLYKTCIQFEERADDYVKRVKKIMEEKKLGNWPTIDLHWFRSDLSLEQRLAALILLDVPVGFELQVVEDSQNEGKYILKISPGRPLLTSQAKGEIRNNTMIKSYMETVLLLLGVSKHKVSGDVEEFLASEAAFVKMEQNADMECGSAGGGTNNDLGTERMPLPELDRRLAELNWTAIMEIVFSGVISKGVEITTVVKEADVFCRKHIREYINHLEQIYQKDQCNYLGGRFLFAFAQHLGPPFYRLHSDYQTYVAKETLHALYKPRWKECLSLVEHYMLPVLAKIYKDEEVPGPILKEKKKIATHVRTSMTDLLLATKWMKEQDQQKIKQKISNSKFDLILNKISSNWESIEKWFENLNVNSSHHLIENVLEMQQFKVTSELKRIMNPSMEIVQWGDLTLTSPSTPNFQGNSIQIHFDKIRPPFLRLEEANSLNYGAFGSYLSRTLLDYVIFQNFSTNVNSKRDSIFWEARKQNKDFRFCSIDKMTKLRKEKQENMSIDSALTELSAVQVSHLAYVNHPANERTFLGLDFSQDQMFFLSYAQSLCEVQDDYQYDPMESNLPARIRVNFALKNFPSFGKAFECPSDSPMNPSSKCQVLD